MPRRGGGHGADGRSCLGIVASGALLRYEAVGSEALARRVAGLKAGYAHAYRANHDL